METQQEQAGSALCRSGFPLILSLVGSPRCLWMQGMV